MENKVDMSLDDIIKLNRSQNKKLNVGNRVGGNRRRGKRVFKDLVSKAKQNRKQNQNPQGKNRRGASGGKYLGRATALKVQTSPRKPGGEVSTSVASKTTQHRNQKRKPRGGNRRAGGKELQRHGNHRVQTSSRKPGGGVSKRSGSGKLQKAKFSKGGVESSAWKQAVYNRTGHGTLKTSNCGKISLSNLDYGVSDSDIRELFSECGQLKKAAVHYDRYGRSLGTADLIFERRCDAVKAVKQYHRVTLDGRPMNIQLLNDAASLTRPVSAADASLRKQKPKVRGNRTAAVAGVKNRRSVANRRGVAVRAAGRYSKKAALTAEQLDAELEAYQNDIKNIL